METLDKQELTVYSAVLRCTQHSSTVLSSNSNKVKLEILFEAPAQVMPCLWVSTTRTFLICSQLPGGKPGKPGKPRRLESGVQRIHYISSLSHPAQQLSWVFGLFIQTRRPRPHHNHQPSQHQMKTSNLFLYWILCMGGWQMFCLSFHLLVKNLISLLSFAFVSQNILLSYQVTEI